MNLLAFDTSTELLSVAAEIQHPKGRRTAENSHQGMIEHAEKLIPMMEKTLKDAGAKLNEIDAFLVGEGPGSFTGLRVGFGTVQGLSVAGGKPCYSIPSLDITAQGSAAQHWGKIAVLMDARRDKVYLAIFESEGGKLTRNEDYLCIAPEDAVKKLEPIQKGLWIAGDGLKKYGDDFKKSLKDALLAPEKFWYPHASKLIELFHERKDKIKPKSTSELLPLYLQEPHIGPAKKKIYGR